MAQNKFTISTALRVLVISAIITINNFYPYQLSSPLIVGIGLLIMILGVNQRTHSKLNRPFWAILLIGLIGAYGHEPMNIFRDISYALTPITIIYIGYWIAHDNAMWPLILKVLIFWGIILSIIHIKTFILNPTLLIEDSMEIRKTAGGSGDLVVLALILGIFQYHFKINKLFPNLLPRFIAIPILVASLLLSFSRTETLIGIILSLSLLGTFSKLNKRTFVTIAILVIGYIIIAATTPANEEGTFRSKILRSTEEITISNFTDIRDISKNWRGFEAYRAVETYLSGNELQLIVGQGFGALIDLDISIALGGEGETTFDYIPITHNGYVYILVKAGALGIICYAYFYISTILLALRYIHSINIEQRFMALLFMGCILSLAASMYVVGGIAEMHNIELALLTGFLFRKIHQKKINNSRQLLG